MKRLVFKTSLAILLAGLLIALVLVGWMFERRMTTEMERSTRNLASTIAANIRMDEGDLQVKADELSREAGGMRVTLVDSEGIVLADSHISVSGSFNAMDREEFMEAAQDGTGAANRRSDTMGQRMMFAVAKTPNGDYVRVSRQYSGFLDGLLSMTPPILIGAVVALLVAIPLADRLSGSITRPLEEYSKNLGEVMGGGVKLDPSKSPYEEVRDMAVAINSLSEEVQQGLLRLADEHQQIETVLSSINEGFVMVGGDGGVLLINDAACRMLECRRPQVGVGLWQALHNPALLAAVERAQATGEVGRVEVEAFGGDVVYEAVISTVPQEDTPEQGPPAVMLLSDISERRETMRIRQEFFQAASHELKTPITSIRGFSELLCTANLDEEKQKECSQRILRESKRMETLIEDILMISRLESGDLTTETEPVDLYEVLRDSCDNVRGLAAESGVEIRLEGESIVLQATQREMMELCGNLLSNAVKYNRPGGIVEAKLFRENGAPVLSVFNTGTAIPSSKTERIFERFYRLDKGRSKAVGGTGLGLAIARTVANCYNAKIQVIPKRGVGNTFIVKFPPESALRESSLS